VAWIAREEMDSKRGSFLGAKSKSDIVAVEQLQQNCFGSSLLHGLAFAMLERSEGLTSITSGFCPNKPRDVWRAALKLCRLVRWNLD